MQKNFTLSVLNIIQPVIPSIAQKQKRPLGYTLMTFFDLSADVNFHLVKSRVRQSITGVLSSQPRTADLQTCDNGHWQ